jgi:phospholipid/cholesterol/gamma-HCH transport system substrate-binding protein
VHDVRRRRGALGGASPVLGRALIAGQAALALAFAAFLIAQQHPRLPWDRSYRVRVELADASGLTKASRALVTIAGVSAGKVEDVRYDARTGRAVARLRLDGDTRGKLHAGTHATVQPRSALQDLVLDLTPGDRAKPALTDGARIAEQDTTPAVTADKLLDVLDADTRAQVQLLVDGLNRAAGRDRGGAIAAALRRLDPASAAARRVTTELARRRALLVKLVGHLDVLMTALEHRAVPLAQALAEGRRTLDVTAAQDRALATAVRELPATLQAVRAALAGTRDLAGPLEPALTRLRRVATRLPGALDALRAAAPAGDRLVTELDRTARTTGPAVRSARQALETAAPTARALEPSAARLRPILGAIDAHKDGIGLLGDRFSGILSTSDANGPILRGLGFFEDFNPANFGAAGATGAARLRVAAGVVRALTHTCLRDNELACVARYLVPGLPGGVR